MRAIAGLAVAFVLVSTVSAQTPEQGFFEWTDLSFPKEVYDGRRGRMIAKLRESGGGVLLVPGRAGVSDGFTFRQLDDFLYFTGLEVPDSMLALDADEGGSATLFVPERDARFENPSRRNDFPGRRLGSDPELSARSGISSIVPFSELAERVSSWVGSGKTLRVNAGRPGPVPEVSTGLIASWSPIEALVFHLRAEYPGVSLENAHDESARLRMVHGPEEIEAMRRVCELTIDAIRRAASFVREGVDERGLEAELEAAFKRGGSQRLGFSSIIKSGPNSLWPWRILASSYDRRNRVMKDGELVVFDVGTELDYYVSDVGRTFPVSGRFTDRQRRALVMITAVSDAVIAAIKPGITFAELKTIAVETIPDDQRRYMQAGGFFGHHIGLSTGDPALADAPLEAGMIFTVEPWYYNHDEGLSVFVEDVLLVTPDGRENLTAALPRDPEGLERMTGAR